MRFTVAILLLIGLVSLVGCGKPFSGDGVMTDNGFFSYPRYTIALSSLGATNGAVREYRLAGVPTVRMSFAMAVHGVGKGEHVVTDLRAPSYQGLILSVEIKKGGKTSVARAHAAIKDWKISYSPREVGAELWHENLRDVRFDRTSVYELSVRVLGAETHSKPLVLRPFLEGGGNEVP